LRFWHLKIFRHHPLWRGSLLPLGREATLSFIQSDSTPWIYDCFAAEREQAPSPQRFNAKRFWQTSTHHTRRI
jgi:hypothetical protein